MKVVLIMDVGVSKGDNNSDDFKLKYGRSVKALRSNIMEFLNGKKTYVDDVELSLNTRWFPA